MQRAEKLGLFSFAEYSPALAQDEGKENPSEAAYFAEVATKAELAKEGC